MAFTHLHVHTEYSLLDGSNKIKEYIERVSALGMNSAAITDHGVMYGVIDFYLAAKEAGINPIIGCEVYVAPGSRFDRERVEGEDRYYHLVLLAENNIGYQNLIKIVSKGFVDGYYYRPRVDMDVLTEHHDGIIALSACLAGEIPRLLNRGLYEQAVQAALAHQQIFGAANYFLELQDHGIPQQKTVNQQILRLSQELNIPLVATNDVHYTYDSDVASHDILLCIQTGKKLADENRMRYDGGQYYVKSEAQMQELFPYAAEAVENTQKIADRCHVEIEFGVTKLPQYDVPSDTNAWDYLNKLCQEGLKKHYPNDYKSLQERLSYELDVIKDMGYVDYFLIVWDFIDYARTHDIAVGPGRGSAAGSLVSYTLGITNIDPMRYNLLFERFLNPERISMPDIDIDFCVDRRQEVIDYVVQKYGKDRVVQIVTFGTMAARGVIRDVGRVMDLPYAFVDTIAKLVPMELGITIERALKISTDLRKLYETDDSVIELIDMSKRLEGLPRHTSMHAAGVVISQKPVDEYVPLSKAADGSLTTQFTMTTLEELGLLKMDFLGLRNLTVIQNALRLIAGNGPELNIDTIDYEDKAVLSSIGTGRTEGVFQLESAGMKSFMKELKPRSLEDIIAGISLYRPGPMDFIPAYIKGKNDADFVTYACPQLEPILAPTYGCIVYQEQVMQIVRDLAGYTMGRSDLVRRAMSKKKASIMEKERKNFVYGNAKEGVPGCTSNGISEQVANQIFDEMTDFAKYAFNKSHAAAYAVVAYQTAYLKYYYPVEYMAALMTSVMSHSGKVSEYIMTSRGMGIAVLSPDINEGEGYFTVTKSGIRYGLNAIKSVGYHCIEKMVQERSIRGPFKNLKDFLTRMADKDLNKRAVENFIKAGALDCLNGTRKQFMMVYATLMDSISQDKKKTMAGQITLFDLASDDQKKEFEVKMPDVLEYSKESKLAFEKEVLGVYISGHPLEEYEEKWKKNITHVTSDFIVDEETGQTLARDGEKARVGGMIIEKTIKYTKNNQTMAFITIEDLVGILEIIIFPRDYEKNKELLEMDQKVFVFGRISQEEEQNGKLICEQIYSFHDTLKELWLKFENLDQYSEKEEELQKQLSEACDQTSSGNTCAVIYISASKQMKRLPLNRNIVENSELVSNLTNFLGNNNVKVVEKLIENKKKRY
jgi:DNA polymerase-3 subunit alpha